MPTWWRKLSSLWHRSAVVVVVQCPEIIKCLNKLAGSKSTPIQRRFQHALRRIFQAFPCISTGIYGYENLPAAHVALETVRKFLEDSSSQVWTSTSSDGHGKKTEKRPESYTFEWYTLRVARQQMWRKVAEWICEEKANRCASESKIIFRWTEWSSACSFKRTWTFTKSYFSFTSLSRMSPSQETLKKRNKVGFQTSASAGRALGVGSLRVRSEGVNPRSAWTMYLLGGQARNCFLTLL